MLCGIKREILIGKEWLQSISFGNSLNVKAVNTLKYITY